jgi:hypothetical protein
MRQFRILIREVPMTRRHLLCLGLILALGCSEPNVPNRSEEPSMPEEPVAKAAEPLDGENNPAFHGLLQDIARTYASLPTVDGSSEAEWSQAMGLCRMPIEGKDYKVGQVRFSFSKDPTTHGDKLYFLHAKDRDAYLKPPASGSPVGQSIVKESWFPEEIEPCGLWRRHVQIQDLKSVGKNPVATKDGKTYLASKIVGLFILAKLDPKTEGTDNGWIYGTVTPEGKVTASGRVGYCMRCHESKPDRLYGMNSK